MSAPLSKYLWHEALFALELSGREFRVLGIIASTHRDGAARLSVPDLVRRTKLPRRTVQRTIDAIERKRLVAIERSRGGPSPHVFTLLDPAGAVLDATGTETENCAMQGGAVAREQNCATLDGAVTAPLYARARISTLTLGTAPAVPQRSERVSEVRDHDLSPSSNAPEGASSGESDDDGWFSSPAEDARRADLIAGRIAVDLPATASETIDDDDAAHSWMSKLVDRAIAGDGEEQIRQEVDELVMAAVQEGDDRALDAEDWLLRTANAELDRRRAAGTGRATQLRSTAKPHAQEDERHG